MSITQITILGVECPCGNICNNISSLRLHITDHSRVELYRYVSDLGISYANGRGVGSISNHQLMLLISNHIKEGVNHA
jgi:hypothetical protein